MVERRAYLGVVKPKAAGQLRKMVRRSVDTCGWTLQTTGVVHAARPLPGAKPPRTQGKNRSGKGEEKEKEKRKKTGTWGKPEFRVKE